MSHKGIFSMFCGKHPLILLYFGNMYCRSKLSEQWPMSMAKINVRKLRQMKCWALRLLAHWIQIISRRKQIYRAYLTYLMYVNTVDCKVINTLLPYVCLSLISARFGYKSTLTRFYSIPQICFWSVECRLIGISVFQTSKQSNWTGNILVLSSINH